MGKEQLVEVRAWVLLVVVIVNQFAVADFWDFVHPYGELRMLPVVGNFIFATFDNVETVADGFNRLAGGKKSLERMNVVLESSLAVGANVSRSALDQMDMGLSSSEERFVGKPLTRMCLWPITCRAANIDGTRLQR